jgi:hypothetical protein
VELSPEARRAATARLDVLVGSWSEEPALADAQAGQAVFEWALDGMYLLMRSEVPMPEFPDSLSVISVNDDGETYAMHYFDSRGVVRVYKMTLVDRVWTMLRDEEDFTPLAFHQRFIGTIADTGNTITGAWESSDDGTTWSNDFDLTYRRLTSG